MSTTKMIRAVIARDKVCLLNLPGCLTTPTVADHRANRGAGGSKVLDAFPALIAACVLCNGGKENATGDTLQRLIRDGLRVLKAATNQDTLTRCTLTPVRYPDGWFRLTMEGTLIPARMYTHDDEIRSSGWSRTNGGS